VPTRSIYRQMGEAPSSTLELPAASNLSGHRLVVIERTRRVNYADNLNLTHPGRIIGLTLGAASVGELALIQRAGKVVEPSWSWIPSRSLWLGASGTLTQAKPTAGFLLVVGVALGSSAILMANIQSAHVTYLFDG
jgi:hypothetical protein